MRKASRMAVAAAALASIGAVACSSDPVAPVDAGVPIADAGYVDDALRAVAEAFCASLATCGGAPPGLEATTALASDPAGCARVMLEHPELGPLPWFAGFGRGDLTLDTSQVASCVEAIAAAGCPWGPLADTVERACKPAFRSRGGLSPGDACLDAWGCATGCSCEPPSAVCPTRTCAYQVPRAMPCTSAGQCLPTFRDPIVDCLPIGPAGELICGDAHLAPPAALGEACGRVAIEDRHGVIAVCSPGLFCDSVANVCRAPGADGDACAGPTRAWCATGLICASDTCRPLTIATRADAPCGPVGADACDARLALACDGTRCLAIGDGTHGSPCIPTQGACGFESHCDPTLHTCVPSFAETAPCTSPLECISANCTSGFCGPAHACD